MVNRPNSLAVRGFGGFGLSSRHGRRRWNLWMIWRRCNIVEYRVQTTTRPQASKPLSHMRGNIASAKCARCGVLLKLFGVHDAHGGRVQVRYTVGIHDGHCWFVATNDGSTSVRCRVVAAIHRRFHTSRIHSHSSHPFARHEDVSSRQRGRHTPFNLKK